MEPVSPEPIWKWGHRSGAKRRKIFFWSCPSTYLALKIPLVVLVSAFFMVSTVWSVSCLLFFYSRFSRTLWSRRHCIWSSYVHFYDIAPRIVALVSVRGSVAADDAVDSVSTSPMMIIATGNVVWASEMRLLQQLEGWRPSSRWACRPRGYRRQFTSCPATVIAASFDVSSSRRCRRCCLRCSDVAQRHRILWSPVCFTPKRKTCPFVVARCLYSKNSAFTKQYDCLLPQHQFSNALSHYYSVITYRMSLIEFAMTTQKCCNFCRPIVFVCHRV